MVNLSVHSFYSGVFRTPYHNSPARQLAAIINQREMDSAARQLNEQQGHYDTLLLMEYTAKKSTPVSQKANSKKEMPLSTVLSEAKNLPAYQRFGQSAHQVVYNEAVTALFYVERAEDSLSVLSRYEGLVPDETLPQGQRQFYMDAAVKMKNTIIKGLYTGLSYTSTCALQQTSPYWEALSGYLGAGALGLDGLTDRTSAEIAEALKGAKQIVQGKLEELSENSPEKLVTDQMLKDSETKNALFARTRELLEYGTMNIEGYNEYGNGIARIEAFENLKILGTFDINSPELIHQMRSALAAYQQSMNLHEPE